MNLAWHHFRKDTRQFRIFLAIWFGLLLLNLAVNQGWVGNVAYSSTRGFDRASNIWTLALPGVMWVLAGLLTSLVVLADSPARWDGFLATRPMPRLDLFMAKTIFIFALVIAPWVLQEWVNLAGQGVPGWVVQHGTLERLLYVAPIILMCGAFAALWPNPARWALSIGIIFASYVGVMIVLLVLDEYFHIFSSGVRWARSRGVVNLYAMAITLVAFSLWHSRGHRGAATRWTGLFLGFVFSQWAASLAPWDFFLWQPADPALAKSTMAAAGFEIPQRAVRLAKVEPSNEKATATVNVSMSPETKPLPPGMLVDWADGNETNANKGTFPHKLFNEYPWNSSFEQADYVAWSREFPPGVLFNEGGGPESLRNPYVVADVLKYPTNLADLRKPMTVKAALEAHVYQWKKIADLPLTPGATATNDFGWWKFVAFGPEPIAGNAWEVFLERRQIELSTGIDSRYASAEHGPLDRMAWMIYDPASEMVMMPDGVDRESASRGTETAWPRYYITLQFYNRQRSLQAMDKKNCRLVIFEKTWVGSVPESWESALFTFDEKLGPTMEGRTFNSQRLERVDFDRRIAALPVLPANPSRREASGYLLESLQLITAFNRGLKTNEPVIQQLARLVPRHLDLMIDVLPVVGGTDSSALLNAIEIGATDAQKPDILAALPQIPKLAEVVRHRHWESDARSQIEQMVKSPRALTLEAMRLIVAIHDPATYPRLLEEFTEYPTVEKDDLLRALPGMEPRLKDIVIRRWRADSLGFHYSDYQLFSQPFIVAMHYGNASALHTAYQVLDNPDFDQFADAMNLGHALGATVQTPSFPESNRAKEIMAWMRIHRADDFVFDAGRRRFVLKKNP